MREKERPRIVEEIPQGKPCEALWALDDIAREGAHRMPIQALEEEVAAYLAADEKQRRQEDHSLVVRNGKTRPRKVTLEAGAVEVRAPSVNDRREAQEGRRQRFTSKIPPP